MNKEKLKFEIEKLVEVYNKENVEHEIEIIQKSENKNVEVLIATNKCSNGLFFYTTIKNKNGELIHPFESKELWKAINEAMAYAKVLGVEVNKYQPNNYVTKEEVENAYKTAEDML